MGLVDADRRSGSAGPEVVIRHPCAAMEGSRRERLLFWGLAAVAAALAVWRWSQRIVAFDDAYISFRYAKNLVRGAGLVFNEGVRIEGYTNFSWTLLSAAGIGLGLDPLLVSRVVGVFFYAAIAAALTVLWCRWTRDTPFRWIGLGVLWLVYARTGFAAHAGTGLETMAVAAMILLVGVLAFAVEAPWWVSSCIAALLCLTRSDAGLVLPVTAAMIVLASWRGERGWRGGVSAAARWLSIPLVVVAAHVAWRYGYYGLLLPNTYYAKAGGTLGWSQGTSYVGTVVRATPEVAGLVLVSLAGLVIARGRERTTIGYGLLYVGTYTLYVLKVGGDYMEYRFMWTVYPVLLLAGTCAVAVIGTRWLRIGTLTMLALVGLTLTQRTTETDQWGFPKLIDDGYSIINHEMFDAMVDEGTWVGNAFKHTLPPDTVIATTLAGTIPYFSDLRTVDQWGLNEPYVQDQEPPKKYARGHVKFASEEYLRKMGVQLYVGHPTFCPCDKPCRQKKPNVFVKLENGQCVRTWYFQQSPELTKHFCAHPESFVLNRVRCGPK